MADFLEEVVVEGAVVVLEGEGAVGGDGGDGGHEAVACCVLKGVHGAVVTVQGFHVALMQVTACLVVTQGIHQLLDAGADTLQQQLQVVLTACDIDEGDGVGGVAEEALLVDVDADAHDAGGDVGAVEGVLQEHAADLFVLPIDIVGPLDGEAVTCLGGQRLDDRQRRRLAQVELVAGLDGRTLEQEGKREVLAVLALP